MQNTKLQEQLLSAWIGLNGILKDSRMTKELTYNEAIIMKLVYDQYMKDGIGTVSIQHILKETNMLKSLVNRTVNSLCAQGFLTKERGSEDARNLFVKPVLERLPDFLFVHARSLQMAQNIIDVIGEEDAESFVCICKKLMAAGVEF